MDGVEAGDLHPRVGDEVSNRLPGVRTANAQGKGRAAGALTPVMARLDPVELDTLNVLVTAGVVGSRTEGIRWALSLVRERPAFAQLRERSREIERLRAEFVNPDEG
jgi:hypothetical protein